MAKTLPQKFFNRPTIVAAKDLIGKYIVRSWRGKRIALMITDVEAYDGPRDKASHASRGRTERTEIMFGEPGHFYIYFVYGMHWLVNIVTGPADYPAAALLRAGKYNDPKTGEGIIVNGPARLAKFLHIADAQNGKRACKKTGLWFEDRGIKIKKRTIAARKRIGVNFAGRTWAEKPYRFTLKENEVV